MRYYIIAGEASGDLHASNLMRGLCACDPACDIRFWGGDAMSAVGGTPVRHCRDLAVMGGIAVAARARTLCDNLALCKKDLAAWGPDAVILVDYPGFNLKIARYAKKQGMKVFYYIAPKVWAHHARRVENLRRDVDVLYSILPFEPEWFGERGVEARYFGNPLVDSLAEIPVRPLEGGPRIALLPGSRQAELKFLMPRYAALERLLAADERFAGYRLTLAAAPTMRPEDFRKYLPSNSKMEIVVDRTRDVLASSRAAVVCSGTASLEAALLGTPQVVCYGFDALSWQVARRVVKVPYVSLPNLVLGRLLVPERLQEAASPEGLFRELERLLTDDSVRTAMTAGYEELKTAFGGPGASRRIANDIYEQVARI